MSALPRLHRTSWYSTWRIADTDVAIRRTPRRGGWSLHALSSDAGRWLARHELTHARFSTRRDALRTAAALMPADPPPAIPVASFQVCGAGRYTLQRGWVHVTVTRTPAGVWAIKAQDARDQSLLWLTSSRRLRDAAEKVGHYLDAHDDILPLSATQ